MAWDLKRGPVATAHFYRPASTAVDLREQRRARPILLLSFAAVASKMRCAWPDRADRFALFNVPFDPPD